MTKVNIVYSFLWWVSHCAGDCFVTAFLAMTKRAGAPRNDEKGSLRAKGVAIPNKRNVIASQRRGNPGGGDAFRASPQLKIEDTLYYGLVFTIRRA